MEKFNEIKMGDGEKIEGLGFVLKGNVCYSLTPQEICIHENAYVVCCAGESQGVFAELPECYKDLPIHDYGDRLIIPGMIDLHLHAPQYAFKGLGMDLELLDWLNRYAFVEEMKYADLQYAKQAYTVFARQMKQSATTRACIFGTTHREATEHLMECMEMSGLISYVGKVNMDRNVIEDLCEREADTSVAETKQWLENVIERFSRTKPILTPRFIPSCSDELLCGLGQIQQAYGLPVQSHLSENPSEVQLVAKLCPEAEFYGDAYDRHGLFGKSAKTIMAHCVYSSDAELERMRENGVYVAHCPGSNLNLASGIAPIRKYLNAGLHVGLGSDIAAGHSESIFRAMTDAIQVSKLYWRLIDDNCKPITFQEAFYMATKGGGAFFGQVGSFEQGYEFDAVVIDDSELLWGVGMPVLQRLQRVVYASWDMKGICGKYVAGQNSHHTIVFSPKKCYSEKR